MIDFIPLEYYGTIRMYLMLTVVLITILHSLVLPMEDIKNKMYIAVMGFLILAYNVVYIGLRPISGKYFVDMRTYANYFKSYAIGGDILVKDDIFFHQFMKLSSSIMTVHSFFLLCAIIYILPLYVVSRKMFKDYWFYSFLLLVVSFSFWGYGVNGIRNGMATSIFLFAIAYRDRKVVLIAFATLAYLFHQSMALPIFAFVLTLIHNKPKTYFIAWLCAIPLSLVMGGFWEAFFSSLGFGGDRLSYLAGGENTGFRFDFLLYSASAVFAGWYFIFKRGFADKVYWQLFNVYLIANTFWILVIRANFSNRFAYLSWFMIAIVIVYPYLKQKFFKNQNVVLAKVIFMYFLFTFAMFLYYKID
ncbi:EpsG family protein [Leptobacterium flavescens]|uniref:EpsG family protein n=1 Tax=Leptobacterium flavescens TaxID=472055 RepID=A0A6P0UKT2_9FLAO|nr:EpsG family protein [Leptobacterium flavescens]NER13981.1 EpsG family protein [Leptobacterium flavescens]